MKIMIPSEKVITSVQAVIDEGNPQLNLKQGNNIVDIVDLNPILANGEKIEGYTFTPSYNTEVNILFAGVSKNGNKVTFVLNGIINKGTSEATFLNLGSFNIPSSVGIKLVPNGLGVIDNRVMGCFKSKYSRIDINGFVNKDNESKITFGCYNIASLENNVNYYVRYEVTFLLSENLIQ